MPLMKRNIIIICGVILLAIFQIYSGHEPVAAQTWLPVKLMVESNNNQSDQESFSVLADVTVYWECSLNGDKYGYGSFLIMDSTENVIVKADRLNGTRSGSFEAHAGVVYIIKASGNSGYDSKHNTHFGAARGTVNYLFPYEWQIYDNSFTGVWKNSSIYLPEKISHPGQYSYDKTLTLNKRSDLGVRNYDIPVWFQAEIGDKPQVAILEIEPGIRIYRCNANGDLVQEPLRLNLVGFNRKKMDGFFILPANYGFLVDVNTGKYTFRDSGSAAGFVCHYKIEYMLDNAPPKIPESPSPIRIDKVKNMNGIFHTNLNPVELAWSVPQDNPGILKERAVISGVKDYQVIIQDNLKNKTTVSDWLNQPSIALSLEEGEYIIKVKARDNEGNESGFSDPFSLIVDRSVNPVSLQDISKPVQLQYLNGTYNVLLTWGPVQDSSGTKYQVALTNSLIEPSGNWDVVDSCQDVFYARPILDTTLYAYIRAIDGAGNTSPWIHTDGFKIWSPSPSFSITPFATEVSGQVSYAIGVDFNNVEAAKYIIERVGVNPVELTYQQLMQNGFKYIDNNNLQKHEQYQYSICTQSVLGVNSVRTMSGIVTIPNIPAKDVDIIVKDANGRVLSGQLAKNSNLVFDITPRQDIEGDELRFKVCYRNLDLSYGQSIFYPAVLQSTPIAISNLDLSSGNYEFWLEYQEFYNNSPVAEVASTPHHIYGIF